MGDGSQISYLEIPNTLAYTVKTPVKDFVCGSHWELPAGFITIFPEVATLIIATPLLLQASMVSLCWSGSLCGILTAKNAYSHLLNYD